MPTSRSTRGYSREHVVRSKRSHAEFRNGRSEHRRSTAVKEDDAQRRPEVEELRQLRTAYYGRPLKDGRRLAPKRSVAELREQVVVERRSKPPRTIRVEDRSDRSHKSRKSSSDDSWRRSKRPRRPDDSEYVYAVPPPAVEVIVERVRPRSPQPLPRRYPSTRAAPQPAWTPRLRRQPSLNLPDDEVTPDDSISQVAERKYRSSRSFLPPVRRSNTVRSRRLDTVDEVDYQNGGGDGRRRASAPTTTTRRSSTKRESQTSILGSFFRRPSVSLEASVRSPPEVVDCLTCGADDVPAHRSVRLACEHRWCFSCLKRLFEMSVTDPAHMPPRCCTADHIPLKHVERLFDDKFKVRWNKKYQEYHTKNRIYCPGPRCGEWIKPSDFHVKSGRKYAQCPRCKMKVCTTCNNKMHRSTDCPNDPEITKLVEQAKQKGWQRCYNCQALVELKEGCNHMTCRCLAEFCMICGAKWKTCDCAWFNYTQLPDDDRLNEMHVPEQFQVLFRNVLAQAPNNGNRPAQPPPPAPAENRRQRSPLEEFERRRRRQERQDRDLARRMQLAAIFENDDERAPNAERRAADETWGIGNAAGHFMNDDYVQNAARIMPGTFDVGDWDFGRRGERAAGRRQPGRPPPAGHDAGLVANFLGDESVVGLGPGPAARP